MANIDTDGSIYVEGHFIGTLEGFQFKEDASAFGEDSKILRAAADKVLTEEIKNKADELAQAEDGEMSLILGDPMTRSTINWRGIPIARVEKGSMILTPKAVVLPTPILQGDALSLVQARVDRWLANHVGDILAPLFALQEAVNGAKDSEGKEIISGMARGIAFQMLEKLGTIPRRMIARDFRGVEREGRFQMKQLGIWLGSASLYIPSLLKPAPAQLRLFLWALFNDMERLPEVPVAGLCTIAIDPSAPRAFYEVSGYRVVGKNAVRLDMLERLSNAARDVSLKGPFPTDADLMSLVGTSGDKFTEIMAYLGYVYKEYSPEDAAKIAEARALKDKEAAAKIASEAVSEDAVAPEEISEETVAAPEIPAQAVTEDAKADGATDAVTDAVIDGVVEAAAPEKSDQTRVVEKIFLFSHEPYQKTQHHGPKKPFADGAKENSTRHKAVDLKEGAEDNKPSPRHKTERHAGPRTGQKQGQSSGQKQGQGSGQKFSGHKSGNKPGNKSGHKDFVVDPHSPFAALAGFKDQLKSKK